MKIKRYKSPLRWPGGKTRALKALRARMPDLSQIKEYREPFLGGGSVFLYIKSELAPDCHVWVNDLFKPLYKFWLGCREYPGIQTDEVMGVLMSPRGLDEIFKEIHATPMEHWTGSQLFIVNRCAYSGNICGGYSNTAAKERFTLSSIQRIGQCHVALKGAMITCQDYEKLITEPGSKPNEVFIFLDPPYYGIKGLYPVGGAGEFDHLRLEYLLRKCRYKFLLTYNDCPEIRELYNWAYIESLTFKYGMDNTGGNRPKQAKEVIICNYLN